MSHLYLDPSQEYTVATFPPDLPIRKAFWEFFIFSLPLTLFSFLFALLHYPLLSFTQKDSVCSGLSFSFILTFLIGIIFVDCFLKLFCFFIIMIQMLSLRISWCYHLFYWRFLPKDMLSCSCAASSIISLFVVSVYLPFSSLSPALVKPAPGSSLLCKFRMPPSGGQEVLELSFFSEPYIDS